MPRTKQRALISTKEAMARWLRDDFDYTHFITLATNDTTMGVPAMRQRIRCWDARVNRSLYGPKWLKRPDEVIWYFAFLEKPCVNPHWHLLLRTFGRLGADPNWEAERLPIAAGIAWSAIMPSGTIDVQPVDQKAYGTLEDYVVKQLPGAIQYEHFLVPDEFRVK